MIFELRQYVLRPGQRDNWVRFARLPRDHARRFMADIEAGGIPVLMLRSDGAMNPDGMRDYDLMVPATAETLATERHAAGRARYEGEAEAWRARLDAGKKP